MLGLIGFFYLKNIFLPVKFKEIVINKTQEFLKRDVAISAIDYSPLKGIILKNVVITEKDAPKKPFIKISEVSFNIVIASFFKNKQIIIPHVTIEEAALHIQREEKELWNFSDLLKPSKSDEEKSKYTVLMRTLKIDNATIHYIDNTLEKPFFETLKNFDAELTLGLDKSVLFDISTKSAHLNTSLSMNGKYFLATKSIKTNLSFSNIEVAKYLPLFNFKPNVNLTQTKISAPNLDINYEKDKLQLKGNLTVKNADIIFNDNKKFAGNVNATDLSFSWTPQNFSVGGQLLISSALLKLSEENFIEGSAETFINTLTWKPDHLNIKGSLNLQKGHLKWGSLGEYYGTVVSDNLVLNTSPGSFDSSGDIVIKQAQLQLGSNNSLTGDISLNDTKLTRTDKMLSLQSQLAINQSHILYGKMIDLKGNIHSDQLKLNYQNNDLSLNSSLTIKETKLNIGPTLSFEGNPELNINYAFKPNESSPHFIDGDIKVADASLLGFEKTGPITNIAGFATYDQNTFSSEHLTFHTQETSFQLSGSLSNFNNPQLDITLNSDQINLASAAKFYPPLKEKWVIDVEGHSSANLSFKGLAKKPRDADIQLDAHLKEVTVVSKKLSDPITQLNGNIKYAGNTITWDQLSGQYKDHSYLVKGYLSNFSRPFIATDLSTDNLSASTQIRLGRNGFKIEKLSGAYFKNPFDLRGDVQFVKDEQPLITLSGVLGLTLSSLTDIHAGLDEKLKPLKLIGDLTLKGNLSGQLNKWKDWDLNFNAQTDQLSLKDYPFTNFNVEYAQNNNQIKALNVSSTLYGGQLLLNSKVDLTKDSLPISIDTSIDNLSLAEYRNDKLKKNKFLSGDLTLLVKANGSLIDKKKWDGNGSLVIKNGIIWQKNMTEGVWGTLLVIPELSNVIFTDAESRFRIERSRFHLENTVLYGENLDLLASGWIDLSKRMNLKFNPRISQLTIAGSESFKKGPTSLLTHAVTYYCSGTLDHPKCEVEKSPLKILENTLKQGVGTILGEIF